MDELRLTFDQTKKRSTNTARNMLQIKKKLNRKQKLNLIVTECFQFKRDRMNYEAGLNESTPKAL